MNKGDVEVGPKTKSWFGNAMSFFGFGAYSPNKIPTQTGANNNHPQPPDLAWSTDNLENCNNQVSVDSRELTVSMNNRISTSRPDLMLASY